MEELKASKILKCMRICENAFICTTYSHECAYGDDGCIDCMERLDADIQALIDAGDDLIIHCAAPENKPDLSEIDRVIHLYENAAECPCDTYAQLILAALYEYKAQHTENKPLTLDQLRQMDGAPVWVEYQSIDGIKHSTYGINWNAMRCVSNGYVNFKHKTYGKTWLAYARKPEGSNTDDRTD